MFVLIGYAVALGCLICLGVFFAFFSRSARGRADYIWNNATEPQTLDLKAGSERLSESELDRHFAQVTPQIQRCVTTASAYGDIPAGSLKFKLRILPSGKVESVSITAASGLRVWGIPSCARKAVYDHRFPAFDGAAMGVSFGVDIQ